MGLFSFRSIHLSLFKLLSFDLSEEGIVIDLVKCHVSHAIKIPLTNSKVETVKPDYSYPSNYNLGTDCEEFIYDSYGE